MISVWNTAQISGNSHDMAMMGGMPMSSGTTSNGEPPIPVATFRPFGARRGAVNLATTYQRQLGGQAQPVIAVWHSPREVAFTAIGLDNKPQIVKRKF
jgi:hypothetical protein